MILKLASSFLKWAQIDFSSPELSWVPKEFKELEPFKKYPLKQVIKKFEEFGLTDFREEVKISFRQESAEKLLTKIKENLTLLTQEFQNYIFDFSKDQKNTEKYYQLLELRRFFSSIISGINLKNYYFQGVLSLSFNWLLSEKLGWKTIPEGTSLFRAYQKVLEKLRDFTGINIDSYRLENSEEFKAYSLAAKPSSLYLVFSTKINDLLGISSRGITSCQDLFCKNEVQYKENIAGTVLSRYIGVIYLTTGEDFRGRGERMISRCLVRLLFNTREEKFYLFLDKMYPKENEEYRELFYQSLSKRSSANIIESESEFTKLSPGFNSDEYDAPQEFIHPIGDEDIESKYQSYLDTSFQISVGRLYEYLESGSYFEKNRQFYLYPLLLLKNIFTMKMTEFKWRLHRAFLLKNLKNILIMKIIK